MLNQPHQDGVRGGYTVINEKMDIIAGAVFRVNVEVLQGGLESPGAKVSSIELNEKDLDLHPMGFCQVLCKNICQVLCNNIFQ